MAVEYKTLILIDNSKSVGEANFTLCRETAKYIADNLNDKDSARIATFGEGIEYITDYTDDTALLKESVDKLGLIERDTYITDNLTDIIMDWNRQDVACRNIILFTDGEEKEPVRHANEELYYLLKEADYPVYVIQSVENKSVSASKNLSAIATISGGELLLTEFDGSEAGSEQIMGERILKAIENVRKSAEESKAVSEEVNTGGNEETGGNSETGEFDKTGEQAGEDKDTGSIGNKRQEGNEVTVAAGASETSDTDGLYIENTEESAAAYGNNGIIEFESPEHSETTPIIRKNGNPETGRVSLNVIIPAVGLLTAVLFAVMVFRLTGKSRNPGKRKCGSLTALEESIKMEAGIAEAAEDYDCLTYKLDEGCNATRLLDQEDKGKSIVLEDCSDPTRLYRAVCDDSLIIGRSENLCDIVINNDDSVSGRHCELELRGDNWYIRDLRSSNGTRVNAQKVFQELLLKNGDTYVKIGLNRKSLIKSGFSRRSPISLTGEEAA